MKTRTEALESISGKSFDICIIGGGATGAGCALDSQLRGFKTVLLEASDFAGATSSASTKLIHGGVRYLEQAVREFDLAEYEVVKRGLRERSHMLQNAPFLAHTTEFVVPCFGWLDTAYYRTGLKLYDWIAARYRLSPSRALSREEAVRRMPGFETKKLSGGVCYADGQFDDSRFNIALIHTFVECGGEALNHARVTAFEKGASGKLSRVCVEDQISKRRLEVPASAFVSATGPFCDGLRRMANPELAPRLRLSKGAHILFAQESLPIASPVVIPKTADGRVLFIAPWQGRVLVGTTDEELAPDQEVCVTREDVEYLLREVNSLLAHSLRADQIVSGFAGVRPLVLSSASRGTSKLARDHVVEADSRSGLVSIMGGKWTTYRAMAEDAIDAAEKQLNGNPSPCRTQNYCLFGSQDYSPEYTRTLQTRYRISDETAQHLSAKFGTAASNVLDIAKADPELEQPLIEGGPVLRAEVIFSARHEMASTIEDVLARRTGLQFYSWELATKAASQIADLMAKELGWSREFACSSVEEYVNSIKQMFANAGLSAAK
jgi:glycerol-3-phosphate dehydrogenase